MATEEVIIQTIEGTVKREYSKWYIGITDYPEDRRKDHGNPPSWQHFNARGEGKARRIEQHFLDKGMQGGAGGKGDADYVYIFKTK